MNKMTLIYEKGLWEFMILKGVLCTKEKVDEVHSVESTWNWESEESRKPVIEPVLKSVQFSGSENDEYIQVVCGPPNYKNAIS